jgi:hypothetical protein
MNKNLDLEPINNLLSKRFFVPHYQRGYRWSKKEVKALLDDVFQFFKESQNSPKEVFYCLQPLVVTQQNEEWVLVDGQQRITTILLILTYLEAGMEFIGKSKYTLKYETRTNSEKFINRIKEAKEEERLDNIDYYHIWEAYQAIEEWFATKDGSVKNALLNTFLNDNIIGKNVKVIWYEVNGSDAIEIFTRINMGKIPLTNAELIKALFLKKDNFNTIIEAQIHLKQIEIASEWDRIENKLQTESFWYFIHDNQRQYDTRIEFVFDLMKNKLHNPDDYFTFIEFNTDFENGRKIDDVWIEVKKYFMTMEEWYNDNTLYHLVGYLIHTGAKITDLIENSQKLSKSGFHDFLRDKIKDKLKNVELDDIYYGDGRIKNLLLLYNIESILQNSKSNIKFPFDEFKKESWDIEHISSVMSEIPSLIKSKKWLENIYEFFTGNTVLDHYEKGDKEADKIIKKIHELLTKEQYTIEEFEKVYKITLTYFKEDYQSSESERKGFTHSISNLTLLDSNTNRSYQNAVFPVKRKRILKNDMKGIFVPLCTKNVFLKCYSEKLDEVMFWKKSDADSYLANIKHTLHYYFLND